MKSYMNALFIVISLLFLYQQGIFAQPDPKWRIHDS